MQLIALVSTMNNNHSILGKIGITQDAVVVNQCDRSRREYLNDYGKNILWIDSNQRGLSRSRNLALKNAKGDVCLLVDDDEELFRTFDKTIKNAFNLIPQADIIVFNVGSINNVKNRYMIKRIHKLNRFNIMKYGSVRIAFRKSSIDRFGICFDEKFGAGSVFSNGEESIFFHDCLKNGLKVYAYPAMIANVNDDKSTWFEGYTEKFFRDKGAIYARMYPKTALVWYLQYLIRHKSQTRGIGFLRALLSMMSGRKSLYDLQR